MDKTTAQTMVDKIVFDLSKVTIGEAVNISDSDLHKIVEYFDKITPEIDMFALPFNLFPIVLARYKAYIESLIDPDNITNQLKDMFDDMNEDGEDDERNDGN